MRFASLLNSITLNSSLSSSFTSVLSSFTRCFGVAKPSTPYGKETTAPLSNNSIIIPSCIEPAVKIVSKTSQGFSSNCLCPKLKRRFSLSISSTCTSIVDPISVTSLGCLIFLVHERSEICIKPSTPSSISTKAPKLVKLRTLAVCVLFTGNFSSILSHGSGLSCLTPNDILRSSRSSVSITASTSSPTLMKSCALCRCCVQLISETWINPSTPAAISTNAP